VAIRRWSSQKGTKTRGTPKEKNYGGKGMDFRNSEQANGEGPKKEENQGRGALEKVQTKRFQNKHAGNAARLQKCGQRKIASIAQNNRTTKRVTSKTTILSFKALLLLDTRGKRSGEKEPGLSTRLPAEHPPHSFIPRPRKKRARETLSRTSSGPDYEIRLPTGPKR